MKLPAALAAFLIGSTLATGGCAYNVAIYEIRDLDTGTSYHTTRYARQWLGGGVEFVDMDSGEGVVLQEFSIKRDGSISSEELNTRTNFWTGQTTQTYNR